MSETRHVRKDAGSRTRSLASTFSLIVARPSKVSYTMPIKSQEFRPFGARLKLERQRLNFSQSEFAAIGGVSKTTQIAYESGVHVPTLSYLTDIANLGVDATFVLTGKRSATFAGDALDWDLMDELSNVLEDHVSKLPRPLSPSDKMHVLRLLYSKCSVDGVVDHQLVKTALILAA